MNVCTEDIKDILIISPNTYKFADGTDWSIYIGKEPDKPDKCITLYDTGGPQDDNVMDRAVDTMRHPSFQIRVRGKADYREVYKQLKMVDVILNRCGPWTAVSEDSGDASVRYSDIFRQGDLMWLEQDDKDRHIWVGNYQTHRKEK